MNIRGKTVLQTQVFDEIGCLEYATDKVGAEGECVKGRCDLGYYVVNGLYGLLSRSGHVITEPLYVSVEGYEKGIISCCLDNEVWILVDVNGHVIK